MTDEAFRYRLAKDLLKAERHAEFFRQRSDWLRCRKKTEQAKGFTELIARFDTWKPKPKLKKEATVES